MALSSHRIIISRIAGTSVVGGVVSSEVSSVATETVGALTPTCMAGIVTTITHLGRSAVVVISGHASASVVA